MLRARSRQAIRKLMLWDAARQMPDELKRLGEQLVASHREVANG